MAVDLPFSTTWPGTLQDVIRSYLFEEYADDADLQAFVDVFNGMAQEYIDWFNQISLPIYTGPMITGDLLDWVMQGLYGIKRPTLQTATMQSIGPYNTFAFNTLGFDYGQTTQSSTAYVASDDLYKRVGTWQHYKGDGMNFTMTWLKRRIMRFLLGVNGTDPVGTNDLRNVSISAGATWMIRIRLSATYPMAQALQICIETGILNLPFQFAFTVQLV